MKLEVGKKYRSREGKCVGIMHKEDEATFCFVGDNKETYRKDGLAWPMLELPQDLISPWEEDGDKLKKAQELMDKAEEEMVKNGIIGKPQPFFVFNTDNLRDRMAIAALQGIVPHEGPITISGIMDHANWAYEYADAMLIARKQTMIGESDE